VLLALAQTPVRAAGTAARDTLPFGVAAMITQLLPQLQQLP
jgi:hypothetical protein